jgi:hypothetical protein
VREAKAARWTAAARAIGEGVSVDGGAWLMASRCRNGRTMLRGRAAKSAHGGRRRARRTEALGGWRRGVGSRMAWMKEARDGVDGGAMD